MRVTAVARRTGGWWAVEVPELHGLFTQARRLDQVAAAVADAARLLADVTVEVAVRPVLPNGIQSAVDRVRAEAAEADAAQRRAAEDVRALVSSLRATGFSVRDVGTVLGVSPQRVSQLSAERVRA
jgi:uncharacterized protein YoxC